MPDATTTDEAGNGGGWMGDVQRILALSLIWTLTVAAVALVMRLVWSASVDDVLDLTKTLLAALVNMGLIALGFFFGNTISKQRSDSAQASIVEKLTPPAAPIPPSAVPAAPQAWWSKLTDQEKAAISAASPNDARVAAVVMAMTSASATPDDLAYLVQKGFLTDARAAEIKGA